MLLTPRSIAALCLGFVLCFCGVTAHMLWQLRDQTWSGALRGADNVLAALSQDVTRNIELYDLSLQAAVDGVRLPDLAGATPVIRHAVLFDRAATARYLGSMLLLDETGRVTDDAGSIPPRQDNFADRDYFRAHQADPALGLFISAPFRRRLTGSGDLVIGFSRRISKPDGSFGGVAVSTLRLDYFKDLFERIMLGEQGAVTLFRDDGTIMVRNPFDEGQVGQVVISPPVVALMAATPGAPRTGRYTRPSALDGVTRTVTFTHLDGLPLVLSIGLNQDEILATWNSRALGIGLLLGAVVLITATLGVMVSLELQRRFRAEAETRESEAQFRMLADHATDVIVRLDASLTRRYVSPSSVAVLGYHPAELVGRAVPEAIHPEDRREVLAKVAEARREQGHTTVTYRLRHRDGGHVWVEGQYGYMVENGGFTVVLRDITRRKAAEAELAAVHAELARVAVTDALTGLANRRRFDEVMAREWARAAREGHELTLLLLDVDVFKQYNDRYGHQDGDACLRAVATAVDGCMRRPTDFAARYGGEEFAALLPGLGQDHATALAESVRQAVAALALPHAGNAPRGGIVTISIGVATRMPMPSPQDTDAGPAVADLIAASDRALYEAKKRGRNRVVTEREMVLEPTMEGG